MIEMSALDLGRHVMRGAFLPLLLLVAWALLVLWSRSVLPIVRRFFGASGEQCRGVVGDAVDIGAWLLCAGIAIETTIYGLVRWNSEAFGWLNEAWAIVALAKVFYVAAFSFWISVTAPIERRCNRLAALVVVGSALWAVGAALSAVQG